MAVAEGWLAATADADSRRESAGPPIELVVHVDHAALLDAPQSPADRTDTTDDDPATPNATLADGAPVSLATARRLACDASVVLTVEDADTAATSRRTRRISHRLRRALRLRDDGCRFPGCTNRITDAHHVEHWVDGGPTSLGNLCSLCRRHHRLVHEHGYRIVAAPDGPLRFFRADGTAVPLADAELRASWRLVLHVGRGTSHDDASHDGAAHDGAAALRAVHAARGLDIDAATGAPGWDGEPVDYGLAVRALLAAAPGG